MPATSWRTAPPGAIACFLCHRYLPAEKLEDGRCSNRRSCQRAIARGLNPVRKLSKREKRAMGMA